MLMFLNYFLLLKFYFISVLFVLFLVSLVKGAAPLLLKSLSGILKKDYRLNKNKLSAYECGFEPFNDSRGAFEVHFHITAILFILFDVEVAFLLPWVINLRVLSPFGLFVGFLFFLILLVGFLYELFRGALDWPVVKGSKL